MFLPIQSHILWSIFWFRSLIPIQVTVFWPYVFRYEAGSAKFSFRSNVVSAKCPLDIVFVGYLLFGLLSFRLNVFRSYVFRPCVRSAISLSAICHTTVVLCICTTLPPHHCTTVALCHCATVALHNITFLLARYYYRRSCHLIKDYPVLGM